MCIKTVYFDISYSLVTNEYLGKWDTNVYNITDLTNGFLQLTEKLLLDVDAIENGVVMIGDAEEMGVYYARHFGLNAMLRIVNTLWVT